jgi:hypothetical protein
VRKCDSAIALVRKCGSAIVRKCESAAKVRKCDSAERRNKVTLIINTKEMERGQLTEIDKMKQKATWKERDNGRRHGRREK